MLSAKIDMTLTVQGGARASSPGGRSGLLPNFVIAGVPKAGTSALHGWLAAHPDVLGAIEKETYFLVDPGTHMHDPARHVSNGLEGYSAWFPEPAGTRRAPRIVMDSTPSYIYSKTALAHLPDLRTEPRVLFVLREPAAQIHSLFRYFRSNWHWIPRNMSFRAYLAAVREGGPDFRGNELARDALANAAYVRHLRPWRERLGAERMWVRLYDDLAADPRGFTRSVAAWLGLDPAFYDEYAFGRSNDTYAVRSAVLQGANLRLRAMLPKGAAYRAVRRLYRAINTTASPGPDADERACTAELREELAPANARLAAEFGLDLREWVN